MITDVGKTAAIVKKEGMIYTFYNRSCINFDKEVRFLNSLKKVQYRIAPNVEAHDNQYRCGHFSTSFETSTFDGKSRLMLYVPNDIAVTSQGNAVTALPLYEIISPFIQSDGHGNYTFSWWSNVQDYTQLALTTKGENQKQVFYQYDYKLIKKFSNNNLGNQNSTSLSAKILCIGDIGWRNLCQEGGGVSTDYAIPTPIIRNVVITTVITGQGYVTDFSTGGDGGGLSIHSHVSNDDGGYAAAVFMPSAGLRPLNWR